MSDMQANSLPGELAQLRYMTTGDLLSLLARYGFSSDRIRRMIRCGVRRSDGKVVQLKAQRFGRDYQIKIKDWLDFCRESGIPTGASPD
jgi:hypothetical protein